MKLVALADEKTAYVLDLSKLGKKAVAAKLSELKGIVGYDIESSLKVLLELGRRECNDVLVEAGPTLAGRFVECGLADELIVYLAPRLLGPDARPMVHLPSLQALGASARWRLEQCRQVGDDLKLVLSPPTP